MKKLIMICLGLLISGSALFAQDIIIKKNGEEIKAKVQDIGTSEIKYKKFENPEGPTYNIAKSEVFIVKYENGSKDVFNEISNNDNNTEPAAKQKKPQINGNNEPQTEKFNFFIKAGGGYGLSISKNYYSNHYDETIGDNVKTITAKSIKFGNGVSFGGALGVTFKKYIGFELGVYYLLGDKFTLTSTYTYQNAPYYSGLGRLNKSEEKFYGRMLLLKPSIYLSPGFNKVNPYMTLGFVYGYGKVIDDMHWQFYNTSGGSGDIINMSGEKVGGYAIGLCSSLGLSVKFSKNFSFFSELSILSTEYIPKKMLVTKYEYNGADHLMDLSKSEKETQFVESITTDPNNPPKDWESSKSMKESLSFDNIGITVGIQFSLH